MKKTYQIVITLSLVIIAACILYTTYQYYMTVERTKSPKAKEQRINQDTNNGGLSPEQQRMLEYEVKIYELQKELEQYKNNQQ